VYAPQLSSDVHPEHVEGCKEDTCSWLEIQEQDLISVLDRGGNPCLVLTEDEKNCIITDTEHQEYIAISHVWSHGLGNPVRNALPWCQVRKLFELIRTCGNELVALWIDTLTVPIQPEYKRKAIAQLRKVYRNAEAVLVLDRYLEKVGPDCLERTFQILGSEWMTRLWTLQEGRLARKLIFRFENASLSLSCILENRYLEQDNCIFIGDGLNTIIRRFWTQPANPTRLFADIVSDLAFRRTAV
jgi:hypothetical protein